MARPADLLADDAPLVIAPGDEDRYVSRGGLKLAGALAHSELAVNGLVCLDVGQSTGGFTDCLLQAGALHVVGIDVGHRQLHPSLRHDPRVTAIEGVNARTIDPAILGDAMPAKGFGLIVIDVSFISLSLVIPTLTQLAATGAHLLALVKPQFEVGRDGLDGRGIVRNTALFPAMREKIATCTRQHGWSPLHWLESPIRGGDGNIEFFMHAVRETARHGPQS